MSVWAGPTATAVARFGLLGERIGWGGKGFGAFR